MKLFSAFYIKKKIRQGDLVYLELEGGKNITVIFLGTFKHKYPQTWPGDYMQTFYENEIKLIYWEEITEGKIIKKFADCK